MTLLPEQFVLTELTIRLIILLVVIIIERHVSLNDAYHPATLYRYIAQKLALKVNKRGKKQQLISGALGGLILFSLPLALVTLVLSIAIFPWFFEALFLLLAISCRQLITTCEQLQVSLVNQRKSLAREQLTTLCVRDTDTLSTMGITKAAIESLTQRPLQSYFNIIIYYALFGIYVAVSVAIINALAKYWNPKQQAYRHFGRVFSTMASLINQPIGYLMALGVGIVFGIKYLSFNSHGWHNRGAGILLATTGKTLKRELGGAVLYDGVKIRRPKLGGNHPPEVTDLAHIVVIVRKLQLTVLTLISFSLLTSLILSNL